MYIMTYIHCVLNGEACGGDAKENEALYERQ